MALEWIVIETLAVLVENYVKIYFIVSQVKIKKKPLFSISPLLIITAGWGLVATFLSFNQFVYNFVALSIFIISVYIMSPASTARKIFIVLLATAISFITTLLGIGVINLFTRMTVSGMIHNQDSSRLLVIILIKMIQIIVFLLISKKKAIQSRNEPHSSSNFSNNFSFNIYCQFIHMVLSECNTR